jgi:TPR repeat protein
MEAGAMERAKTRWFEETETARSFLAAMRDRDPTEFSHALHKSLRRATFLIGTMYRHGCGVHRNAVVASRMLCEAAIMGDTHAIVLLAEMYPAEKFRLYRWAAELGHDHAQFWTGCAYTDGVAVAHDPDEAVRWYRASAMQGNICASLMIAQLFVDGAVHFSGKVAAGVPEEVS